MSNHGKTLEELQPAYDDEGKRPKTLTRTCHIDDVLYVAGRAPIENQTEYEIMFVCGAVEEDEATQASVTTFGYRIPQPAEYLKGPTGIVRDVALRVGIDLDKCYYTAVCKWVLPRLQRARPPVKILKWGMPILMDEIERVKPKIIVCMGKHPFDMLSDQKIGFKDAHGCWFWSDKANAHLYLMHAPFSLIGKPDLYETFRVDFQEIKRRIDILESGQIPDDQVNIEIIRDMQSLDDWVSRVGDMIDDGDDPELVIDDDGNALLGVDCEWHGRTHIDGNLRTMQLSWTGKDAVVIEFRDEQNRFAFDVGTQVVSERLVLGDDGDQEVLAEAEKQAAKDVDKMKYSAIGEKLQPLLNRKDVKYIGHHYSADAPWMNHWLGLDIYRKCAMDTEFAQQTCDESSELGLERGIAMKYTSLGRYDQELVMWKRENKKLVEGGYGFIPSAILHPYGARDVITPIRAYPLIKKQLEAQRLWDYYKGLFNPFVTDVFTEFCMTGLPMDMPMLDNLRILFNFARGKLQVKFQERVHAEARSKLLSRVALRLGAPAMVEALGAVNERDETGIMAVVKKRLHEMDTLGEVSKWITLVQHYVDSVDFNIRSPDQMRRWLFDVEELEPIKTTNQKAKGLPSMAWEKVLELPPERQKLYTPAVDKQTLAILSEKLPAIDELLDLNAVGNIAKAFLKEADVTVDEESGEETVNHENGLHAWIASDKKVHGMTSTTETGRPRAWCPNVLNWPSYVNNRINRGIAWVIQTSFEEGDLPEELLRWVGDDAEKLPSIRSVVTAPPGWCLVESDYATAEMVGLAVISNDKDLQRILFEPDPDWAMLKESSPYKAVMVRVDFSETSPVPECARDPDFIMKVWDNGECLGEVTDDMLLRDADGNVQHAKYDIHWTLAETTYDKGREMMTAKISRAGAKVVNFSSAYGASAGSLERKIESDTGVKPAEGTGDKGLDAIAARQPRATEFLEEMAAVPKTHGMWRAASGRIRHCLLHGAGSGVGWRTRNSLESALGREMKNFPLQESVGATSARACKWLLDVYRKLNLKARPMICLYDSIVTLCPLEERFLVSRLHQAMMSDLNSWDYGEGEDFRTLQYTIDNEFNYKWSTSPTDEETEQLKDTTWHPTPDRLRHFMVFENWDMFVS